MKRFILTFIIIMACSISTAHARYSASQINKLDLAYEAGQAINGLPETMQAIILQESSACKDKFGDDHVSLGCGHVTERAAIDVFDYCKKAEYNNECIILGSYIGDSTSLRLRLVLDDRFNVTIAAIYLKMQYEYFKSKKYSRPWTRAVVAYNCGRTCVKRMSTKKVTEHVYIKYIRMRLKNVRHSQINKVAVMSKEKISTIIDEMIDTDNGHISSDAKARAVQKLEEYVIVQRSQALGWAHANAVMSTNAGVDIGKLSIDALLDRGLTELSTS